MCCNSDVLISFTHYSLLWHFHNQCAKDEWNDDDFLLLIPLSEIFFHSPVNIEHQKGAAVSGYERSEHGSEHGSEHRSERENQRDNDKKRS